MLIKQQSRALSVEEFQDELIKFNKYGKNTSVLEFAHPDFPIPVYVNEYWTSKQRAANPLHEVSYRACFKPQLPSFFITRLSNTGDLIYDPFMGRGTTVIEATLLGRKSAGCDINPLSRILTLPRLHPPDGLTDVIDRLEQLDLKEPKQVWDELLVFYHPTTLLALTNLRDYLLERERTGKLDYIDSWIRMVATNRLTGHSTGFFSVYTMPPNQAVTVESQRKINEKREQIPPERDIREIILKKSRSLLKTLHPGKVKYIRSMGVDSILLTGSSDDTPQLPDNSVKLVVTSPPFLDMVNYKTDNWLRCWFNGFDVESVNVWQIGSPWGWQQKMIEVFKELRRVLEPGGYVAFEVGEIRGRKILLEELVVPAAKEAGLEPLMVIINDQVFTKTSNCWGVDNLTKGTNTNRIVLMRKPAG